MKKYFIVTYGCQMNWSDSERIAAVLEAAGYPPASNISEADLIIINICSVRQSAIDRIYPKIQNANSKRKIILTGCILKSDIEKFKDKVNYILPIKTLKLWPEILKKEKGFLCPDQRELKFNEKFGIDYLKTAPKYKNNFIAYIPIMTGCDNFCSYCVVPYTRGPEISRPPKDILNEARNLTEKGCKEIWLLGQNVNSYKSKIPNPNGQSNPKSKLPINFAKLLKMAQDIPGDFWIRFTSPHPKDFSDELAETIAKCEKITPYLNLPIQSGDNRILKKMNRPYTAEHYKNLVEKIKNAFKKHRKGLEKNIFLSTDVIVGFPGETKKQFENTAKIFKEIKFDMAYISQYSPRQGTAAFKLKDSVSHKEKKQREKILTEILKKTALENGGKFKGKEIEALISKSRITNPESEILIGKSRHYKTVKIQLNAKHQNQKTDLIGKFVKVKIISVAPFGFEGKLLE